MNTEIIRYLVVVPFMDMSDLDSGEPVTCGGIIVASSLEGAMETAEVYAMDMASEYSAWLDEAEGLPFEAARKVLRNNGFIVGDPVVVPLADLSTIGTTTLKPLLS